MVDIVYETFDSESKGSKDDPVLNSLPELLHGNGITPRRIFIKDKSIRSIGPV